MRAALRWSAAVLVATLVFLSGNPVSAWGDKGHVIVATLAEAHVNQAAKKALRDLLHSQRLSDPRTATWADRIRPLDTFKTIFPHNNLWHFIDTPIGMEVDIARDGNNGDNVVTKLGEFQKHVVDATQMPEARREALLFIVHFVGDLHQPLHCIDRKDRGGNDILISIKGQHTREHNLHSFWDTALVVMDMGELEVPEYSARLDSQITAAMKKEWMKGGPLDWAKESHKIAEEKGYTLRGKELPMQGVVDLDDAYISAARPAVALQLQKAGIRLAKVLNDTVKTVN